MIPRNIAVSFFYIFLVISSPQMTAAMPVGAEQTDPAVVAPFVLAFMIYRITKLLVGFLKEIDNWTGNIVSGAFSWTYNVAANGTRIVKGTVPLPALLYLGYKFPKNLNEMAKKLNIEVKDMPKLFFTRGGKSNVKRWKRI